MTDFNLGEICATYRSERGPGGLALDVLKSGMQKSIRRGLLNDAAEMDLFAFVEKY